jgi:hypothetical protein
MELQGTIKMIDETKTYGTNGFRKRELVLTTEEQYPQHILIEFIQDKTDLLNNFEPGQQVRVNINIRGREWTTPQGEVKYFNSINGWKIERIETGVNQDLPPLPSEDAFEPASDFDEKEHDDLPF